MTTDREILELAARAYGIKDFHWLCGIWIENGLIYWNPLKQDGDVFLLAVKLKIEVNFGTSTTSAGVANGKSKWHTEDNHKHPNIESAARRAIVVVAAEVGSAVEKPISSASITDSKLCKKCRTELTPGKAIEQTGVVGMPDFPSDKYISEDRIVTMYAGGPGKLIDCLKCPSCGWSMTISKEIK